MNRKKLWTERILAFFLTLIVMMLVLFLHRYAPFGGKTLATMDADNQYLDFFAWFQDLLKGKNDLFYTFSKTLGGSFVAEYAYYLASPLNILVLFFKKGELHSFFDLVVCLKMAIASLTFCFFLQGRFAGRIHSAYAVGLSMGFGLMQYQVAQSSNIMWLDGVCVLPLILLGVYLLVREKRSMLLTISVGISILLNWYTGGVNCLFCILWFFYETGLFLLETEGGKKKKLAELVKKTIHYGFAMIAGVLLSVVLFLPTILLLQNGRGYLDWQLFRSYFNGNPLITIQYYAIGALSEQSAAALFCGSLPVVGALAFFTSWNIRKKEKLLTLILFAITILAFYYQPIYLVFSLFKEVKSFWFRFSYIGCFTLLFIAGYYFSCADREKAPQLRITGCSAAVAVMHLAMGIIAPVVAMENEYLTVAGVLLMAVFVALLQGCREKKKLFLSGTLSAALVLLVCGELFMNAASLADYYYRSKRPEKLNPNTAEEEQMEYTEGQESLLLALPEGAFRVSQTSTRNRRAGNLYCNYNEALAYGYWSVNGYTSAQDSRQIAFLDHIGYRNSGESINVVNTSVLGADSLLGVRYVLSAFPLNGLLPREETTALGKRLYENPYALPMGFLVPGEKAGDALSREEAEELLSGLQQEENPFLYQNRLYSILLGRKVELYLPVEHTGTVTASAADYAMDMPEGNYALYGNLEWSKNMEGTLLVNGEYETDYSCWLSPSVFYIPAVSGQKDIHVRLNAKNGIGIASDQFYVLDLDLLGEISALLSEGMPEDLTVENGKVSCTVDGEDGEYLFLSVPYEEGWRITNNNETIEPVPVDDCLMLLPLSGGENRIVLTYHVRGGRAGILGSVAGILLMLFMAFLEKRQIKKEKI